MLRRKEKGEQGKGQGAHVWSSSRCHTVVGMGFVEKETCESTLTGRISGRSNVIIAAIFFFFFSSA